MKLTKEMKALMAQQNDIARQWANLAILLTKAKEIGVNAEIREMLEALFDRYFAQDQGIVEQLDALADQQEASHE